MLWRQSYHAGIREELGDFSLGEPLESALPFCALRLGAIEGLNALQVWIRLLEADAPELPYLVGCPEDLKSILQATIPPSKQSHLRLWPAPNEDFCCTLFSAGRPPTTFIHKPNEEALEFFLQLARGGTSDSGSGTL